MNIVALLLSVIIFLAVRIRGFHLYRNCCFLKVVHTTVASWVDTLHFDFSVVSTLKPCLHRNANRTRTRHAKTMRTFNVDLFLRRGKQHSAVWQTFGKQPNTIHRLSVHKREFAYNTFISGRFAASANAEQSTNLPTWTNASFLHAAFVFAFRCKPTLMLNKTSHVITKFLWLGG